MDEKIARAVDEMVRRLVEQFDPDQIVSDSECRSAITCHARTRSATEYAVIPGYPSNYDPITVEDAETAMRIMRRVRADVRRRLASV